MTPMEIILAVVGFMLCAIIFALISIVIMGIVWYVFKTDKDITIDEDNYE